MKLSNIFLACLVTLLLSHRPCSAAHPLISDDAATISKGAVQVELIGDISSDRETSGGSTTRTSVVQLATTIGVGVTDQLDVSFGVARPWGRVDVDGAAFNSSGSVDLSLFAKWLIFEREGFSVAVRPQLGYSYAVGAPSGDHAVSYGAALILSKEFEPFAVHLNFGYAFNDYNLASVRDVTRSSIWNFSLAGTYDVIRDLKLVADFGAATNRDKGTSALPLSGLAGIIYSVSRSINLSCGIKAGLTRPETDLAGTFGVTLTF